MKIQLFEDTTEHIITIGRKEILDRIVDELFGSNFGLVYSPEDVDIIKFYYKGYPNLEAFLIIIELKFIESEDVINGIDSRMKNIDSKLGFMSVVTQYLHSGIICQKRILVGFKFWLNHTYQLLQSIDFEYKTKFSSTFNLWEGNKYKSNILKYKKDYNCYHPTQKPILLLEDLIKTFSNEGNLVVDLTMGSGSTGVACKNTNRNFIGIEKDENYYNVAVRRCS